MNVLNRLKTINSHHFNYLQCSSIQYG